jgi:hypothetical protein
VVLVMVECVCTDVDVAALELGAEQWAQDLRFRAMAEGETRNAGAVVIDGNFATVGAMLALASEAVTRA